MFGYLNIQGDKLADGKRGLWQTFMCGLCLSTKNKVGNVARMFVNNDINAFNVLFHSICNVDVTVYNATCVAHPLKKRTLLDVTEITDKLALANVLLMYWNLYDDVVDGGASIKKRVALAAVKPAYDKARKMWADLDKSIADNYAALRSAEERGETSIDRVSHHFARLAEQFAEAVLGDKCTEHAKTLCYNLGKWIYLIDALDDVAKDIKKGNYNPFVAAYGATSVEDVTAHEDEIRFVLLTLLNRVAQAYNDLNLTKYRCILDNILLVYIRNETARLTHCEIAVGGCGDAAQCNNVGAEQGNDVADKTTSKNG